MTVPILQPILRWTRFLNEPYGSGGEKRAVQLQELLEDFGVPFSLMTPPPKTARLMTWWAGIHVRLRHGRHASVDDAGIGLLGYRTLFYRQALKSHQGARVLWWETTYDDILPRLAKEAGYTIVALPHNLESLVSDRVFANVLHNRGPALAAEVRRLRRADAVFTIAREERWFLEGQGLKADYLPFFVPRAIAADCERVRTMRMSRATGDGSVRGPLLLLGSAFNPATQRGMERQLRWLTEAGVQNTEVIVAGRDTDRRLAGFASANIQVLGTVDRSRLEQLMTTARAMLVHTEGGAGALTRIPESLLAGVPVIANSNAARDQYGTLGVHVYETPLEFRSLVQSYLPIPPAPERPRSAERRLIELVRKLASSSGSNHA